MAWHEPTVAIVGLSEGVAAEALTWVLADAGNDVVGAYETLDELDRAMFADGALPPQVAIVDADDPATGVRLLSEIRGAHPQMRIILLCGALSPAIVRCATSEGVDGVVLKSGGAEQLGLAVSHALEGRAIMPASWNAACRQTTDTQLPVLSMREREVLDLAAAGLSNGEIAQNLMISTNTVKFHLHAVYSRLGVRNRLEASRALRGDA